jgi:hypothetical protein
MEVWPGRYKPEPLSSEIEPEDDRGVENTLMLPEVERGTRKTLTDMVVFLYSTIFSKEKEE